MNTKPAGTLNHGWVREEHGKGPHTWPGGQCSAIHLPGYERYGPRFRTQPATIVRQGRLAESWWCRGGMGTCRPTRLQARSRQV